MFSLVAVWPKMYNFPFIVVSSSLPRPMKLSQCENVKVLSDTFITIYNLPGEYNHWGNTIFNSQCMSVCIFRGLVSTGTFVHTCSQASLLLSSSFPKAFWTGLSTVPVILNGAVWFGTLIQCLIYYCSLFRWLQFNVQGSKFIHLGYQNPDTGVLFTK